MPSGDTSEDASIASARQSFLILRWQRVLFDQSTLARMYLTRRSVYQESLLGMKGNLLNPTTEALPAASLVALPVTSSPLQRTDRTYGDNSVTLHIQKTDVTLQGGRCPADQPSNVTAVGRPHVSTPEAFSKAATPIYIFITNSKIALFHHQFPLDPQGALSPSEATERKIALFCM